MTTAPAGAPRVPAEQTRHFGINEVFVTLQGEGVQAGMPAVFLRFAGCNLGMRCARGATPTGSGPTTKMGVDGRA